MFKPGLSVTAASLGNKGIIEARNQFDVLEVSEGGWEYQSTSLRALGGDQSDGARW